MVQLKIGVSPIVGPPFKYRHVPLNHDYREKGYSMLDLKVPWQTAYDQPLPSRWEPCACPVKAEWIFNVQTCQKGISLCDACIAAPFSKHPGSDMGWRAEGSGSEDLGSYKLLIRRSKSDGINLTSIIQHASADKISISWNMTCRNAKNLVSARLNSEMLQVACFLTKNLPPHLSSLGFIPRRIGFPRFFQQKSQTVDLHKKKTSSESQSCFHQLQNPGQILTNTK